jgi:hypothetical protein
MKLIARLLALVVLASVLGCDPPKAEAQDVGFKGVVNCRDWTVSPFAGYRVPVTDFLGVRGLELWGLGGLEVVSGGTNFELGAPIIAGAALRTWRFPNSPIGLTAGLQFGWKQGQKPSAAFVIGADIVRF